MYFYTRNSLVYAVSLISFDFQRYRYFSISGYGKKEGKNASWKLILRKSKKHFFLFIRDEKRHVLYTRICILNCRIDWNRSQTLKLRFQKVICEKRFWRNKSCPKMKKSCQKLKLRFQDLKYILTGVFLHEEFTGIRSFPYLFRFSKISIFFDFRISKKSTQIREFKINIAKK